MNPKNKTMLLDTNIDNNVWAHDISDEIWHKPIKPIFNHPNDDDDDHNNLQTKCLKLFSKCTYEHLWNNVIHACVRMKHVIMHTKRRRGRVYTSLKKM